MRSMKLGIAALMIAGALVGCDKDKTETTTTTTTTPPAAPSAMDKMKDSMSGAVDAAKDKASDATAAMKDKASDATATMKDKSSDTMDAMKANANSATDKMGDMKNSAVSAAGDAKASLVTTAQDYYDKAKAYIASNNLTSANDMVTKLDSLKAQLPAEWAAKVDDLKSMLAKAKASLTPTTQP